MTQQEIQQELMNIGKLISDLGTKKSGSLVTSTFGMEQTGTGPLLDMEILVPLDKEVNIPTPYIFKKLFHLKYAVYARYEGNPQFLQNTLNQMLEFIKVKKFFMKDLKQRDAIDDMVTNVSG